MVTKTTLAAVNKALRAAGHAEVLVKGDGYLYFAEGHASAWFSSAVGVCYITDLTVAEWLAERDSLANDYRNL